MVVPTIALYASPPSSVCSTPHACSINSHTSYDFDLNGRSTSSSSSPASTSQKSIVGGLSCIFSSSHHPVKNSSSSSYSGEELVVLWQEKGEDFANLSSSSRYSNCSSLGSSMKRDQAQHSPVSVFQGPVSSGSSVSLSPPKRIVREKGGEGSFRIASTNGLFNSFVRNSLSSWLDSDSTTADFRMHSLSLDVDSSAVMAAPSDELTFNMEGNFAVGDGVESYVKDLLVDAQLRHKVFREELVVKAFYEAEKAHKGQMRASGDPYLQHCVETAVLLAIIGANSTVVAAGLMHDTIDDSFLSYDYICSMFGAGVAELVLGVSKLSHLSKLARDNNTASKTAEADRLHTMFLAMADARAVLIKLADRLHNMITLDALPLAKQKRFAKETLEIFVPLANRLGISNWKDQLENLCFKHLYPDQHEELSSKLAKFFDEEMIKCAIEKLEQALKDENISYHVLSGRHKSLYSIYCKMLKKKLTMDEIHDIHGLRLIVQNEEDCFRALNVVHQIWSDVPGKLKDYIHHPKYNGYQSLHTVVMGEGKVPLEVQIRTKEMHSQAEFGFAAHWRYKEGDCKHSSFVLQMVEWARWVVTWQCEAMNKECSSMNCCDSAKPPCIFPTHSEECQYCYKPDCCQDGPVFVILIENDKMSVQEFPSNSTVMDIIDRVGYGSPRRTYGFPLKEELRPRLNQEPVVDPTCKLKMGDVIELTPAIPDKSLGEYREEIQRMYNRGLAVSNARTTTSSTAAGSVVGWRS